MRIHFPVDQMTFWRYFIPVAKEAKARGHDPVFSLRCRDKYNNPCTPKHKRVCDDLIQSHGFRYGTSGDVTVCIEGTGYETSPVSYVLTSMYDFSTLYKGYIDNVNHVVLPSEYFSKFFNCISDKNLYFGSPKYDVDIKPDEVYKKYGLSPNSKYALVVYPRARDMSRFDVFKVCEELKKEGYIPLLKTRGKDPIRPQHRMYTNFADESWYPHTSMELLTICDRVVNTGSSMIKEAAMMGVQSMVKNYNVKPANCNEMPVLYSKDARDYLGPKGSASKRILDHIECNYG